ncbi:MAG: hypothetical protein U5L04_12500 [Trueperaceae bacterium]|nr:hypothetical protein [Trueperaceae bacterium]
MAQRNSTRQTLIGLGLVGLGVLALLASADSWPTLVRLPVALLCLVGGGVLVRHGLHHRRRGPLLTGGGLLLVIGTALLSAALVETIVLALLGGGFVWFYLRGPRRRRWWALLPGGLLLTLALMVGLEHLFPRLDTAPILFLGLAATFTVLYLLPDHDGGRRWALYPALFWILIAVLTNDPIGQPLSALLPLILIASGAFLIWRAWERTSRS